MHCQYTHTHDMTVHQYTGTELMTVHKQTCIASTHTHTWHDCTPIHRYRTHDCTQTHMNCQYTHTHTWNDCTPIHSSRTHDCTPTHMHCQYTHTHVTWLYTNTQLQNSCIANTHTHAHMQYMTSTINSTDSLDIEQDALSPKVLIVQLFQSARHYRLKIGSRNTQPDTAVIYWCRFTLYKLQNVNHWATHIITVERQIVCHCPIIALCLFQVSSTLMQSTLWEWTLLSSHTAQQKFTSNM